MIPNLQRDKCGHLSIYCHIYLNTSTRFRLIWKIPPLRHFKLSRWRASKLESNVVRTCYGHLPSFLCSPALALSFFFWNTETHCHMKAAVTEQFWLWFKTRLFTVNEWTLDAKKKDLFVCLLTFIKLYSTRLQLLIHKINPEIQWLHCWRLFFSSPWN